MFENLRNFIIFDMFSGVGFDRIDNGHDCCYYFY